MRHCCVLKADVHGFGRLMRAGRDAPVRLALEAAVPASDPALQAWTMEGYGGDQARFPEQVLDAQRAAMLARLEGKVRP